MPSSAEIMDGLAHIANTWSGFAIGWHVALVALVAAWLSGWRPSRRRLGLLLTLPLASVSVFAWLTHNPFNGTLFALGAITLAVVAARLPKEPVRQAAPAVALLGIAMLIFGWVYPHFLEGDHALRYLYAAPTGLIPCPTLASVIGVALWVGGLGSRSLSLLLAVMGLFYGIFGALRLGVHLDAGLVIGAAAIGVVGFRTRCASHRHSPPNKAMSQGIVIAGTLLLVLAAAISLRYQADLSAARHDLLSGSRIAHTACGPIEYAVTGSGPAVLVIHGAGGGYSQVADFSARLAQSGFKAIAMSRFGYLQTPLPKDPTPPAQADAYACLLDALNVSTAAAIGLSAGAPSAIQYALRHAQRCSALVLLVPAIAVPGRDVEATTPPSPLWQFVYRVVLRSDFIIWAITRLRPEMLVETVLATPLDVYHNASHAERRRALGVIRDIFPVSPRAEGLLNDARVTTQAPITGLEQITAPTLAISASDDLYRTDDGARYATERIPDARLLLFPSGGHAWLGHDSEVREAVVALLRAKAGEP